MSAVFDVLCKNFLIASFLILIMKAEHLSYFLWTSVLCLILSASSCRSQKNIFTPIDGPAASFGLMRTSDSLFVQIQTEGFSQSKTQILALHLADSTFKAEIVKDYTSIIELFKQEMRSSQQNGAISESDINSTLECLQNITDIDLPTQIIRMRSDYDHDANSYHTFVLVGVNSASLHSLFIKCMFRKHKLYSTFKTTEAYVTLNRLFPPPQ